tara:strand:- start:351 stop:542 length:192 start_codon:yes stop_codon:yes gene_type:complete
MPLNIDNETKILELLEIMICPKTGGKLIYDKENKEIISEKGKIAYPIIDGIPVMLVDQARKIK